MQVTGILSYNSRKRNNVISCRYFSHFYFSLCIFLIFKFYVVNLLTTNLNQSVTLLASSALFW